MPIRALFSSLSLCPGFAPQARAREVPWGSENALPDVAAERFCVRRVASEVCQPWPECDRPALAPCCAVRLRFSAEKGEQMCAAHVHHGEMGEVIRKNLDGRPSVVSEQMCTKRRVYMRPNVLIVAVDALFTSRFYDHFRVITLNSKAIMQSHRDMTFAE